MSIKHCMQIDYEGRVPRERSEVFTKTTYHHIQVGEVEKKLEQLELKDEESPFLYSDFSLSSLIASGNVDLLNPVGTINDNLLNATDNMEHVAQQLSSIETYNNPS